MRDADERLTDRLTAWRGVATRYGKTPDGRPAGHTRASVIRTEDLPERLAGPGPARTPGAGFA